MENDEIVIRVENVYKDFILPHERVGSVKGIFTSMFNKATRIKEKQHALKDISFEIKKGEFFGIVGRNGSGKTTLLKLLASIYQPTKGNVTTIGKLVPFIELGVGFNPELSGRDNVYLNGAMLGFSSDEVEAMYDEIVSFAELERFMDQKLKNYSSGMQVRLAFSMATRAKADILLVDEVLAVGDADFQRKCFEYFQTLKKNKKTVVFVSHDMDAVREFCDRAVLIDDARLKASGLSGDVAKEYSLLFIDNQAETESGNSSQSQRWGTGDAKYDKVKVITKDDHVYVQADVTAKTKDFELIQYGIHISGVDGKEIVATNNRMVNKPDIIELKKSETVRLEWEVLNIFSDGRYFVTLTLVDGSHTPLDWYSNAASFVVKRIERSTTAIMPPMSVVLKTKHGEEDSSEEQ